MRTTFPGRVAAVTGAGSGIGRALALGLARRGVRLALSDVGADGLGQTADLVKNVGAEVHTTVLDVRDRQAVSAWARAVAEHYGVVHQVYNNAGVAGGAPVEELDYDHFARVLDVNLWGVVHGTREFLPHLVASGAGHVVNISSLNGFMAQPGLSAYCSSKFAVRGFTESLRAEMVRTGRPVCVTVVHPGGVRTNIAQASVQQQPADPALAEMQRRRADIYDRKLFTMTADQAAHEILRGVERGRPRVLIGQARAVDRLVRLLPGSYPRLIAAWDRRMFGDDLP